VKNQKKLVVANWKMNPAGPGEARKIFSAVRRVSGLLKRTKVVVCPPAVYSSLFKIDRKNKKLALGVQNIFGQLSGPFTGEIGVQMAKNVGAEFAIVGHSERRVLGETDAVIAQKAAMAVEWGLNAIVCIGEKSRDQNGDYFGFLKTEIQSALSLVKKKFLGQVIVAYEPIWAIGKSFKDAMQPREVHEMAIFIKKVLSDSFGKEWIHGVAILYGGSVNYENAGLIVKDGQIDGLLVGRESLSPEGFKEILKAVDAV
jgi:triosephosphate isomerase